MFPNSKLMYFSFVLSNSDLAPNHKFLNIVGYKEKKHRFLQFSFSNKCFLQSGHCLFNLWKLLSIFDYCGIKINT